MGGATGNNFTIEVDDSEQHNHNLIWDKAIEHVKNKKHFNSCRGLYCRGWKKVVDGIDGDHEDSGFIKNR